MRYSLKYTFLTWVFFLSAATATTINVPDDYDTIQAALPESPPWSTAG